MLVVLDARRRPDANGDRVARGGRHVAGSGEPLSTIVVAGYGNPLRGDDGVGWRVVEAVQQRFGDRVRVLQAIQPLPEWAAELATADITYFVDAAPIPEPRLSPLPSGSARFQTHTLDAIGLVELTRALYGRAPRAYLLSVPAIELGFGEGLSIESAAAMEDALALLRTALIEDMACTSSR